MGAGEIVDRLLDPVLALLVEIRVEGDGDAGRLQAALGANGIRCVRVPLEELFIEMVGANRGEEA